MHVKCYIFTYFHVFLEFIYFSIPLLAASCGPCIVVLASVVGEFIFPQVVLCYTPDKGNFRGSQCGSVG